MRRRNVILAALAVVTALAGAFAISGTSSAQRSEAAAAPSSPVATESTRIATFAGGCFWCMEPPFDHTPGVISTISGYMGGTTPNPTYEQVASGRTGHAEVLQVTYDPAKVTYEQLLDVFWHNVDPTDAGGQFCDRGSQYRTEIFVHDDAQKAAAEASKAKISASGELKKPIVTPVSAAGPFTAAEDYHQDFYKKNPSHYYRYRIGCGRDRRLEVLWGKTTQ